MSFPGYSPAALDFLRKLARNNRRPCSSVASTSTSRRSKRPPLIWSPPSTISSWTLLRATSARRRRPFSASTVIPAFLTIKLRIKPASPLSFTCRELKAKHRARSFYFHFNPKELLIWGGVYMPPADELRAFRALLAERHEEFRKIVSRQAPAQPDGRAANGTVNARAQGLP